MITLPVALRGARVRVGPPVLFGALVVVVLVLAVVGGRMAWAQRSAEPTPIPPADAAALTQDAQAPGDAVAPEAGASEAARTAPAPAAGSFYVHVIGAVHRAGVVEIPAGSRVGDVVEAAGGLSASADPARLNLARSVVDGERIWVPVEGEEPPEEVAASVATEAGGVTEQAATGDTQPPVDLNTAESAALQTLPGVGPVTAEAILAWRAEHGSFSTVEELVEVSGVGPRTLERLRPLVTVSPS